MFCQITAESSVSEPGWINAEYDLRVRAVDHRSTLQSQLNSYFSFQPGQKA
jgi:hypothetical protein